MFFSTSRLPSFAIIRYYPARDDGWDDGWMMGLVTASREAANAEGDCEAR
jgi:hypothetical protein